MTCKPINDEAFRLELEGTLALADAEAAGIAIDVPYLRHQYTELGNKIARLKKEIDALEEGKTARTKYGRNFDPSNNNHVAWVLQTLGHELPRTSNKNTDNVSTSAETLQEVGGEFVEAVMCLRKFDKARNTYIAQWLRELDDSGYMHPFFNLHTTVTYRSSSDSPNFQNVPRRDVEINKLLRRAIVPSADNRLVEVDYGAMEVRIIACYTKDPVLCEYIESGADMHCDVAAWDLDLDPGEVTKVIRDMGKNGSTFPRFYGSWWKSIAANYWKRIVAEDPKTTSGKRLRTHVESFQKDFEEDRTLRIAHIKATTRTAQEEKKRIIRLPKTPMEWLVEAGENKFWKQFQASRDWQDQWVKDYEKRGYFEMLTGHRCGGLLSRNDLYNWPIQGTAFLCLLWSFIQTNKWMKSEGLESCLVGQIHDSMVNDCIPREFSSWATKTKQIMTEDIRDHWKWIRVPLLAEFEQTEVNGNWSEKEKVEV